MLCDCLGGGVIRSPLLHCIPVICPQVCWGKEEKRQNGTMIKCLSGTLVLVSGSGEQLDASVCCHAGIGTDRFHSLLHCRVVCSGSARWRLLELWDVAAACKGQDETSQPCVWFACHYLSCQGCPAARGPLRNSPGDVLAVRGSCIALGQRLRHFFQRYTTQLLKTHTVTPNPY